MRNRDLNLASLFMPYFKGRIAISLGLIIFVDDVRPAPAPDVYPAAVCDPKNIRLALHKPDRETMDRKDIEGLKRHRVITAEHVLVTEQVRKVGCKRVTYALVLDS